MIGAKSRHNDILMERRNNDSTLHDVVRRVDDVKVRGLIVPTLAQDG